MKPLVRSQTEIMLQTLMRELPQSLLLTGDVGVGLGTIARYIASTYDVIPSVVLPEKNEKIDLEKGNIPVSAIRDLYLQTRTKRVTKQIIIIDYAERMSLQAQNAFLKLLEEPSESTYFILASHAPEQLLPTVLSRMRHLEVRHATHKQSDDFLDSLHVTDQAKRAQLLFMATGLPAELKRLVEGEAYFESRATIMRDARDFLRGDLYSRLLVAHRYKDTRVAALSLLEDASKIIRRTMSSKPTAGLSQQIESLLQAHSRIAANGNIRLCLAQLVV